MQKPDSLPTYSVVIPSYNRAAYLTTAIESALGQTHPPLEVIVVDDGSTDESLKIARGFEKPVTVVEQENRGVSAARNRAMDLARGDWLAFLDADDMWEPEKLERQLRAATGDPDIVCVFTDFYAFGEDRDRTIERRPDHTNDPDYRVKMLCEYSVLPSTAIVRAGALGHLRFPVGVTDSEDMIFFVELRERGPFLHVPEPLTGYRILETSAVRRAGHELRSVSARFGYMQANANRYSKEEREAIRRHLSEVLVRAHGRALWRRRDPEMARAYRRLFDEVRPPGFPVPEDFRHKLYPRWMFLLRDAVHRLTGI